jgi:NADPH-dependent 2,4-dienoyl-CoA reductase/sulfur reductase-like enzyme/rhodanese-related sulfurtransferase
MKLVIIGGVAAGATAAARARRLDEHAEIVVLERGPHVSYANCGLPYCLSGDIAERDDLLLQTPESFRTRYAVDVRVETEVLEIDRTARRLRTRSAEGEAWVAYDALILAQGGAPIVPPIPGADGAHVFTLWSVPDMDRLDGFIRRERPRSAVVVGGGFIGLEMAEAFRARGLETAVVEAQPTVLGVMDAEFGRQVARTLESHRVRAVTGTAVKAVLAGERAVELSDGRRLPADLVLVSVGVRPELTLVKQAGLAMGASGGLLVDETLRTSDPHIWAAGDMVEVVQRVSGRRLRVPLAGPANRQGRIAATNALGGAMRYGGALGTSVVKVFEATAAMTGLSERAAREAGFEVGVAVIHKDHHAGYYPGAKELSLKLIYDRATARLLGAQAFGEAGVDKRIDVLATALASGMTVGDLAELDLAYAPPYGSANDPVNVAAFVAINDLTGESPLVTAGELAAALATDEPPVVLDVRTREEYAEGHLADARHIPLDELRERAGELDAGRPVWVYCRSGYRAHLASRVLKQRGFERTANVTGGYVSLALEPALAGRTASPTEAAGR